MYVCMYIFILKCSAESCDTVLNTWEVELYKVIVEDGKLNYDFIPTSLFLGCPLIREQCKNICDEWATTKQACGMKS